MTFKYREKHDIILLVLIALFSLTALLLVFFRQYDHDELEHVHCAWYVLQGNIPYLDFYQNHHPALWFFIAPFILFFGESTSVLFLSRVLMLLLLSGIALSVRAISREAGSSAREANYAVLLALSCTTLLNKSMEIRPDVPQVLFGLLSCLCFLTYLKDRRTPHMVLAGLFAGVSFVVIQKAVFLFAAMGISFLWLIWRKTAAWRDSLLYALGSLFPIAALALYLLSTESFRDYILTCWLVNMNQIETYSPLNHMFHTLIENLAFWFLAGISLWTSLLRKRGGSLLQMVSLWGLLLLAFLFMVPRARNQYFILPIAILAVPAARQAVWLFERFKCSDACRSCALILVLIAPWCITAHKFTESNKFQLERIRYVLSQTAPHEPVYDGDIQFNIFRPDLHYFWYNTKPRRALDSYNQVAQNRFSSYDIHELIKARKPAFISDASVDINDPRIKGVYTSTPFPHLYRLMNGSR